MTRIISYLLILVFLAGFVAFLTKPTDEKCLQLGKEFATRFIVENNKAPETSSANSSAASAAPVITVEDNYFYKSIYHTYKGKVNRIGYACFGNVKLSYSKINKDVALNTESMHPMLIIFSL